GKIKSLAVNALALNLDFEDTFVWSWAWSISKRDGLLSKDSHCFEMSSLLGQESKRYFSNFNRRLLKISQALLAPVVLETKVSSELPPTGRKKRKTK
ncbi:hypothetical protein P5673_017291, partial [Acropora cervicornis]